MCGKKKYSLQFSSSDRSWQSKPPSHFQLPWIHCPLAHWNSCALQRTVFSGCCPAQFDGHSSDPSAQSLSPSQRHRAGTHTELLHWKAPELQVGLGQKASSEPSEQSLSLSQTKEVDIHWPLVQRNSSALHCLAAVVSQEMKKKEVNDLTTYSYDEYTDRHCIFFFYLSNCCY